MTVARALLLTLVAVLLAPPSALGAAGDLDQRFGTGGTLVVPLGIGDGQANGIAVAPDGDLLVAGDAQVREPDDAGAGARQLFLARFSAFGERGFTSFFPPQDPPADTGAAGVAIRPDGRVVTAGSLLVASEARQSGLVALHGSGGALDPAFGGSGWNTPAFDGGGATAVAALPDGSALVAGSTGGRGELVRLLPDGSGDPGFGTDGLADRTAPDERYERYDAVAALPGGGAVVAGTTVGANDLQVLLVARFTSTGTVARVDTVPLPGSTGLANAVAVLGDGSVVAAGTAGGGADADWALVRLRPDGTLDPEFGDEGRAVLPLSPYEDHALALATAPDGKLVVGGYVGSTGGEGSVFTVARLTARGRLDPGFGAAGVARVQELPGEVTSANAIAVLPDGAVVAAGSARRDGRNVGALARLLGDGPTPPLATSDPAPPSTPGVPVTEPPRGRFAVRLISRTVERGNTLRVRVRWPRGWRGAARIRITRVRSPRLLIASRRIQGRGGRGRVFRVKVTRLGRDALLGVSRTVVRTELLPAAD